MPDSIIERALKLARKRHKAQYRDGRPMLPYFMHPVDVVNVLRYEAGETDEDILAVGFLHDLLEETETTLAEIEERFGPRIAALVAELTRTEPSAEVRAALSEGELWELRNQLLLDEISKMSPDAQKVKLADRVSNLRGAKATKEGEKLDRYLRQSRMILERIPREVSPVLWDTISILASSEPNRSD